MSRIDRVRILLVSIGMYGRKYLAEATEKDVGGDVAGIVDIAQGLEEKYPVILEKQIPLFQSLDAFFAAGHADLAVISSPIHMHTPMVLSCLARGASVLCEKPLCLTEEETRTISDAARNANRFVALGWQLNYDRAVLALKKDISAGRFGAPKRFKCLHAMRRGNNYYARSNWAGKITADGREVLDSPFMNACAHQFQMMTFLLGGEKGRPAEITSGEGELYRGNPTVENFDIAALRFMTETGVPLLYYTAHPLQAKNLGPEGTGEFEHATLTWGREKPFRVVTDTGEEIIYGSAETPMMQKLYDAVDCVKSGGAPLCGPEAGLAHLRAVRIARQWPVRDVDPAHVNWMELENDRVPCVQRLEENLAACAAHWALPRELGITL